MKKTYYLHLLTICALLISVLSMTSSTTQAGGKTAPTVLVTLDGLQVLDLTNPNQATVRVLDNDMHQPRLTITRIKGTNKTTTEHELIGNLSVGTDSGQPLTRREGERETDRSSLEWALRWRHIHDTPAEFRNDAFVANIIFNSGDWHVTHLTDDKYTFFSKSNGNFVELEKFRRAIGHVGAAFDLQPGQQLTIEGLAGGPIALAGRPGVRYEVAVTNLPPKDMANMNHFLFFYDALVKAPAIRFEPHLFGKAALLPPPLMCGEMTIP